MLILDEINDKYLLKFDTSDYADDFEEERKLFYTLRVHWDMVLGCHWTTSEGLEELIAWFKQEKIDYRLTRNAKVKYDSYIKNKYDYSTLILNPNTQTEFAFLKDIELKKYQIEDVNFSLSRKVSLCANSPGLGKTITAITYSSELMRRKEIDAIFVITKSSLMYQWQREYLAFTTGYDENDICFIDNINKKTGIENLSDKKIIIIPNHLLSDLVLQETRGVIPRKQSTLQWGRIKLDLKKAWKKTRIALIIDEAHHFKNPKSVMSKALKSISDSFDHKLFLTATPAINSFLDWYGIIYALSPKIIPFTFKAFTVHVAKEIGDSYNIYAIHEFDLDKITELNHLLSNFVVKRRKIDIPEFKFKLINQPIYFQLDPNIRKIYDAISEQEADRISYNSDGSLNEERLSNTFQSSLQLLDNPELMRDKIPNKDLNNLLLKWTLDKDPRVKYLEEEMRDLEEMGEKLIIFDNHPKTLDFLAKKFNKYCPLVIHGGKNLNKEQRQEIQDRFNNKNDPCKLLLLSYGTSSSGLNLQRGGRRVTFFSLIYDALFIAQAMERTHRINSTDDTIVKFFIIDNTLDVYRYYRVQNRVEFNDIFLAQNNAFSKKIHFFDKDDLNRILKGAFGGK